MSKILGSTEKVNGKVHLRHESAIGGWRLFRLAMACYLPAFGLVVFSFIFLPGASLFSNRTSSTSLTEQQIEQIIAAVVDDEINAALDEQQKNLDNNVIQRQAINNDTDSIFLKGYIDGQVQQEVQSQAEKAAKAEFTRAKTEIETLKTNWTADLFNQIAFAVIFTVASIFAAFAVKDVLTEILKDQEKARIKQDLKQELEGYVTDDLLSDKIRVQTRQLTNKIEEIEAYTYWLEHELLTEKIIQILADIQTSPSSEAQENEFNDESKRNALYSLEKLLNRSQQTLEKVSGMFLSNHQNLLKQAEQEVLEERIKSVKLTELSEKTLLKKLSLARNSSADSKISKLGEETISQRFDSIFEAQIALLISTLEKLPEKDTEFVNKLRKALYSSIHDTADETVNTESANIPPPWTFI